MGLRTAFAVFAIGGRAPAGSSIGSTRIRLPFSSTTIVALRTSVTRMPHFTGDSRV